MAQPRPAPFFIGDDLALELGEAQQNVERQPPKRVGGIKLLSHRHKADRALIEAVHQSREIVSNRSGADGPVHPAKDQLGLIVVGLPES